MSWGPTETFASEQSLSSVICTTMPAVTPVAAAPRREPLLRQGSSDSSLLGGASPSRPNEGNEEAVREPPVEASEGSAAGTLSLSLLQRRWQAVRDDEQRHETRAARHKRRSRRARCDDDACENEQGFDCASACVCCVVLLLFALWVVFVLTVMVAGALYVSNTTRAEAWEDVVTRIQAAHNGSLASSRLQQEL